MAEPVVELSFEDSMTQLEQAVEALEAGNLPLEESLALFERGVRLAAGCNSRLDAAELRIRALVPQPGGSYEAEPWDPPE